MRTSCIVVFVNKYNLRKDRNKYTSCQEEHIGNIILKKNINKNKILFKKRKHIPTTLLKNTSRFGGLNSIILYKCNVLYFKLQKKGNMKKGTSK